MSSLKKASLREIVSYLVIAAVVVLCLFSAATMLVLPPDSLKADPVYQKF